MIRKLTSVAVLAVILSTFAWSTEGVKRPSKSFYGMGTVLGRPVKASFRGLFVKTWELQINLGGFFDSNKYIGTAINFSTESEAIFRQFQHLDPDLLYLFDFVHKHPVNVQIEDSHYQIINIRPIFAESQSGKIAASDEEVLMQNTPVGWYSSGDKTTGRLIYVERVGYLNTVCMIKINMGGLSTEGGRGEPEAITTLIMKDEAGCVFAEKSLERMQEIEVSYTQDWIEIWDGGTNYVKSLKILDYTKGRGSYNAVDVSEIKQSLLRDPQFLQSLKQQLSVPTQQN